MKTNATPKSVMLSRTERTLAAHLLALCEAMDPCHQGLAWPDPIRWDGRPIDVQARNVLSLARSISRYGLRPESPIRLSDLRREMARITRYMHARGIEVKL